MSVCIVVAEISPEKSLGVLLPLASMTLILLSCSILLSAWTHTDVRGSFSHHLITEVSGDCGVFFSKQLWLLYFAPGLKAGVESLFNGT